MPRGSRVPFTRPVNTSTCKGAGQAGTWHGPPVVGAVLISPPVVLVTLVLVQHLTIVQMAGIVVAPMGIRLTSRPCLLKSTLEPLT